MNNQRDAVTVPVSQAPRLGHRDTPRNRWDSRWDMTGTEQIKDALFNELQRDTKGDRSGAVQQEERAIVFCLMGQGGIRQKGLR